ncbi:MAG: YiiX/YebB-like N1pC/P60 family cysteine hydrolase [Bacteroidota bacterium]|nr:YiiX/YebB-like N1pC/P60 family cysteine hydrolase [Bacteroidota bacterium]
MRLILESTLILGLLAFIFVACNTDEYQPVSGDLLFQVGESSVFSEAVIQSTKSSKNINFSHVGIVEIVGNAVYVIEAVPEYGVRKVTLSQFLSASAKSPDGKPLLVACRLKPDVEVQNPVENAHLRIGMPYDSVFSHDNQAYYCSELIYVSYCDDNLQPVFSSIPMSFSDTSGNPLPYWESYFEAMDLPIPEGASGTNPTQLFQSEQLEIVHRYW